MLFELLPYPMDIVITWDGRGGHWQTVVGWEGTTARNTHACNAQVHEEPEWSSRKRARFDGRRYLRGRSQLSTFMKAYTAYARGEGVWDHRTLFPRKSTFILYH